jgi:hypothetical protein
MGIFWIATQFPKQLEPVGLTALADKGRRKNHNQKEIDKCSG